MRILLAILVIALVGGGQQITKAQSATETIKYGEIEAKFLSGPDSDDDVWFSLKVEVRNEGTTDKSVEAKIRGLDAEGFEVVEVEIKGKVKAGQKRVMTESTYVNSKVYKSVVKWEVED